MGATATHRAPERVADGTCTQVWAWITNKCRKRMNRGGVYIYIASEISQGRKEKRKKGRLLGSERSLPFLDPLS